METLVEIENTKKNKNRRVHKRRVKNNKLEEQLKIIGVNCAGLRSKMESFDKILSELNCSIFFLQETKLRRQGTIKSPNSPNYTIFVLLRKENTEGGLL